MANFVEVIREYKRMCKKYRNCMDGCPLQDSKCMADRPDIFLINPEKAEQIIMQWAAEHPVKTNRMKFREVFGMESVLMDEDIADWLDQEYKGGQKDEVEQ